MKKDNIPVFQKRILSFYKKHGRHKLPWRTTKNPYRILVSEIMLQQTQVDRVLPKYKEFLKAFPTVQKLSEAKLRDVLAVWSGLGYNRRGKLLYETAKRIVEKHDGKIPKTQKELEALPGIGPYTASAIMAFAYNEPVIMIETNIRSVFLHEFFQGRTLVTDAELLGLIYQTVDIKNPREWYWALMDYGTHLKKTIANPSRKSAHHVRQAPFKGSNREVRGAILKALTKERKSEAAFRKELSFGTQRITQALKSLQKEGLVQKESRQWGII